MKKVLSILCVAALLLTLAVGCNQTGTNEADKKEDSKQEQESKVDEPVIDIISKEDIENAVGTATGGATPEEAASGYYTALFAKNFASAANYITLDAKAVLHAKNIGEKASEINPTEVTDQMVIDAMDFYYGDEDVTYTFKSIAVTKFEESAQEVEAFLNDGRVYSDAFKKVVKGRAIASVTLDVSGEGVAVGTTKDMTILLYKINDAWFVNTNFQF